MSSAILIFWGLSLLTIGIGVLALVKGGPAERAGAALILGIMIAGRLVGVFLPESTHPILRLTEDGLTAIGLLVIALRYASFWLGGAMLLYAALFALHATYFVLNRGLDPFFTNFNNFAFFAISACLGVGTFFSWRQRIRARAAAKT